MKPLVVATATDNTLPRTYSGSRQKVVAHDIDSAPDGARIAALTHAARWLQLRIAAPLAVGAREHGRRPRRARRIERCAAGAAD
jgi:hypothetical protein